MTLFDFVLFLHVAVVLAAFTLAGAIHGCDWLMRRAQTVGQLRMLAMPAKLGPVFGGIVLALLVLGMTLLSLSDKPDKFTMSDPFVWTALIALAVLFGTGPTILAQHTKRLDSALEQTADGPIPAELRVLALNPLAMRVGHLNTFLAAGVVFNMVTKPNAVACLAVLVAASALGVGMGTLAARPVAADLAATPSAATS